MRFFNVPALLAATLFSVIAALPFVPTSRMRPDFFHLEARMTSSNIGRVQVYYEDGSGLREELAAHAVVTQPGKPQLYRLQLPPGTYKGLRFDPLDRGGAVTLHSLRVMGHTGRVIADLPLAELKPVQQIEAARRTDAGLELAVSAVANDPQLAFTFPTPLKVSASWLDYVRISWRPVLLVFALSAVGLFALDRAERQRNKLRDWFRQLALHPTRAVSFVASVSVIASAYPVVFLGKSYVSPNLGTALLYDTFPTLPGYKSDQMSDVKLSDIGAVMWQHVPYSMMQRRALAQGELPLWNRYNSAGVPLLAQGQSMFGDPVHFLVIAANGAAWAWDLKYLLAKWLFATGLALTVLTLLGARPSHPKQSDAGETSSPARALPAALLVAFAAPFIGFFLYRINHPAFFGLCYAPWPLYCLARIAQANTRRAVALWCLGLIVANLALMNSGTVKEAYMLLACVNFSGLCIVLAHSNSWRDRIAKLSELAWAGAIFVLLTAPIWSTFLQTLKNAYTGYNAASAYQIQPSLLLGVFDEIFYRPLMSEDRVFAPSLNFLLLLGVLYFAATLRSQFANRSVIALAVSSLVPLSLAFGFAPPQWIVTVPFLSNIAHLDNTFSCVLIVLWSVLAGVGFATAARRLGTPDGRGDLIIVALLAGALVFAWVGFRQAAHRPIFGATFTVHSVGRVLAVSPFIWSYLIALLAAAAALVVLLHRSLARRTFSPARSLLVATCVVVLVWRHGLHASHIGYENFTARPTVRVNFHARSGAMEFAREAHAREPGRGFGFQGNFHPGWTGAYGLETIHGPDALVNPWLRELVGVSGVERIWDWRLYVEPPTLAKAQPFFDALNVRFYFDMLTKTPSLTSTLRFAKEADLDVYESPTAWPRAFFTDRVELYDQPAELVEKIRTAAGKPFGAVQRSDASAVAAVAGIPNDAATRTSIAATKYRLTENTTSFHVRATGAGVVVLTEALWPGDFRAEVNGRKATVVRLNHAFKGVVLDRAGDYAITFRYWPKNFPRNLALCGIGALFLLLSLFFALRARPARRSTEALP